MLVFEVKVDADISCQDGNTALHKNMQIDSNLSRANLDINDPKRIIAKEIGEMLILIANVRKLNNDLQTPLYFASKDRMREWGGGGIEVS